MIIGASDFFVKVFGEAGKHAGSAVAVAGLPRNCPVEVQVVVEPEWVGRDSSAVVATQTPAFRRSSE